MNEFLYKCLELSFSFMQQVQQNLKNMVNRTTFCLLNDMYIVHHHTLLNSHWVHATYHIFESIFNSSDHQALVWNFLLGEEACGWGAGWARSPCSTTKWGSPSKCTLRCWGEMVIDGLLPETCWGLQTWSAEDLHYFLEVQGDVVMEKAGCHYSHPRACMTIKQCPVVQGQVLSAVLGEDKSQKPIKHVTQLVNICILHLSALINQLKMNYLLSTAELF